MIKELDKIAQEGFGEFGFDTCTLEQQLLIINELNTNKLKKSSGELKKFNKKVQLRVNILLLSKFLIFLICFGDEPQHAPIIVGDFFI